MSSVQKLGGIAGLLTVIGIILFGIVVPSAIAGQRISGTLEISQILSYYNHPALIGTFWTIGPVVFFFLLFILAIYQTLRDYASPVTRLLLLAAVLAVVIEVPLLITQMSLQWTLVTIAGQHAAATDLATRTSLETAGLVIFRFWDILYNSLLYWTEAAYLIFFSFVFLKTRVFAHWIGWLSLATGAYQIFNTTAIPLGVPDTLTLPGNILFMVWFFAVSLSLLKAGAKIPAT